ncbi:MAG: DNA polymerase IV [Aurantimicrobium sp.]|nr:DNA polymerase IV [Aurantimicrobium sp.]
MDAFFASVELLERPELRGKPAVVAHDSGRSVVTSATYEARALGVHSAMPLAFAKRAVPGLIVLEPHRALYTRYSREVMQIFSEYSPLVEALSIDEAFIDVTGARRLYGEPAEIGALIRDDVLRRTGLTCSVGVASTKFVAKIASDMSKPDGLLEVPHEETLDFLHPLPIRKLWGVGVQTAKVLERRGLHTVGDVADTPEQTLVAALGEAAGRHLFELAWGRDPRTVIPERREKSVGREQTFATDLTTREPVVAAFLDQAERVGRTLRVAGLRAKTVGIKITFADFQSLTRSRTLPEPTDVGREIYATACALFDELELDQPARPIRLVGVRAQSLVVPEEGLVGLWEDDNETWRKAEVAVDRVTSRFGPGFVTPATLLGKRGSVGETRESGEPG